MRRECPFCGLRLTEVVDFGEYAYSEVSARVKCVACEAVGPKGVGQSEAVRLWNERVAERSVA